MRYGGDWGHVRLAGILRKVGYDTRGTEDNEPDGHQTGWGLNATTAIKLGLATPRLGIVYGRGIATYMNDGGMDLAPSVSPILQPPNIILVPCATAVKLLGYSFTKVDNTNFQDATAFHKGEYASANLLYAPFDNVLAGVEFLWGRRTGKGTDTRMQSSFKRTFSSKNIWDWVE